MKKLMIMAMATLLGTSLLAQNKEVIAEINQKGTVETDLIYISTDEWVSSITEEMAKFNKNDLRFIAEQTENEIARLDGILNTRSDIIKNETNPTKQIKKLEKYFTDLEKAAECFTKAETLKARALKVHDTAESYLNMVRNNMPVEKLTSFTWFIKDSYGNTRKVRLARNDNGKAEISYDDTEKAVVDDSIFDTVDKMIKEGQVYDLVKQYSPIAILLDANDVWSWYLSMNFGSSEIFSSGTGVDPDHRDALVEILEYIRKVFEDASAK